jgi:site-specific recombinase XerD
MKKKVILKRIFHRDRWRIALLFDFDEKLKAIVNSINGIAFSSTNKCFYVDDSEENLKLVLKALRDIADVDISSISWKEKIIEKTDYQSVESGSETIPVTSSDQNERDYNDTFQPRTIRTVAGSKFENKNSSGVHENLSFDPVEFRISEKEGLLVIKFLGRYDSEWIKELRSYGSCYYDKKRREWLLQWSKLTCDSLADYFSGKGVGVKVKKQVVNQELESERKITGDDIRSRNLGKKALDGLDSLAFFLDENRYSPRTKESYLAMLEFFFRYFSDKDPFEITEDEISRFIYDFIIRLGYSAAYQNQMVSAIKMYYTISGKGKVHPEFFERPRRRRALPKVFSKEEVSLILNSSRNLKHKLLLWMIYACGLRRSEVTNIKLTDLDRERSILHIREGKGRVDRIVPVSDKVWEKIDEYARGYRPRDYLFEGQAGGRYSSESVYRVFKEALLKAGIKKDVGVHSLRHSYATHLHENGLDIRYIQELLGHKSTRTTEIYTHVSRRNLVAVRSPIEDLDLK